MWLALYTTFYRFHFTSVFGSLSAIFFLTKASTLSVCDSLIHLNDWLIDWIISIRWGIIDIYSKQLFLIPFSLLFIFFYFFSFLCGSHLHLQRFLAIFQNTFLYPLYFSLSSFHFFLYSSLNVNFVRYFQVRFSPWSSSYPVSTSFCTRPLMRTSAGENISKSKLLHNLSLSFSQTCFYPCFSQFLHVFPIFSNSRTLPVFSFFPFHRCRLRRTHAFVLSPSLPLCLCGKLPLLLF